MRPMKCKNCGEVLTSQEQVDSHKCSNPTPKSTNNFVSIFIVAIVLGIGIGIGNEIGARFVEHFFPYKESTSIEVLKCN